MSNLSDNNTSDSYDNALVGIMGDTDNTRIGNVLDRLKVTSNLWTKKLQWVDLNATSGGVARDTQIGTTFTDIFSYTGSGYFVGFNLCLEDKANWYIRIVVDGSDVLMGSTGIYTADMVSKIIYGWEPGDTADTMNLGLDVKDETIKLQVPLHAIRYDTSIAIKVKHSTTLKKFRAGIALLEKST